MASFLAGEIDGLNEVQMELAEDLVAKGYKHKELVVGGTYSLEVASGVPESAWYDIRMRQALEYAIDKEKISDVLGGGFTSAMYEILRGSNALANPGTTPRNYDPEKAKQLMAEAGYAEGLQCKLFIEEKFYGDHVVAVQAQLAEVGIDIDIDVMPGPAWMQERFRRQTGDELRWDRTRGRPSDLGILFYAHTDFASTSINYPGTRRPPEFEELLAAAKKELDPAKRLEMIGQMEKILYDDVFLVPINNVPDIEFITPDLKWDPDVDENMWWEAGDRQTRMEICWLDR